MSLAVLSAAGEDGSSPALASALSDAAAVARTTRNAAVSHADRHRDTTQQPRGTLTTSAYSGEVFGVHNFKISCTIRYDTRCYINVRSKANMSQLNLPHGTDN